MTLTATLKEMDRLILEIELRTTAQAEAVAVLVRGQGDATEAMQHLYEQMDRLAALRLERAGIERLVGGDSGAASKFGTAV